MPSPSRILLIRPSALGDVCRSVPVLVSLRRAFPEATIDWLVQDTFIDAIRQHPDLDNAVPFPRGLLGRTSRRGNVRPSLRWMNTHLKPTPRYDLVLDAQGLFRSGLFSWWTQAPRRVGYANAAEFGGVFYTERFHIGRDRHAVDRMLALVAAMGLEPIADMRLHADPDELRWVEAHAPSRYAVLAPTSRWPGKQWPADRFTELARRLLGIGLPRVVIVGGPGEREQVAPLLEWVKHEPRATDLVGETSVARLMAIIARASLVVANDSAALHMAVGFDRPLVALFGPTRVGLVGPYRHGRDVIQHTHQGDVFDHKDEKRGRAMMQRITVEEVFEASADRLRG
ncbi:MAG TPA: glycosyltransferase family 9 protein [Phycisphaerales bacterium]|nr:glycosyltransferase family 9 protein [Phycisphaerales bacterium]